jgi:hypothetical protein
MSTEDTPPRRIAFVWMKDHVEQHAIVGDWPPGIVRGDCVHIHEINRDGTPFVKRGRKSGVEYLHYNIRRYVTCDEVAMAVESLGLKGEYRDGDGQQPEPDRSTGEAERAEPAASAKPKRRGYFRRAGEHASVQGG